MSRWRIGEAQIEKLLAERQLRLTGAQANGEHVLGRAARTLLTPSKIADDPDSAFILAYDAARYAGTALLAQQGLRDPPPAAAMTPSSLRCSPNSATDSAHSSRCDAAATNSNTPAGPARPRRPRKPTRLSLERRTHRHWVRRPPPSLRSRSAARPRFVSRRLANARW
jgi:hypothetical protein